MSQPVHVPLLDPAAQPEAQSGAEVTVLTIEHHTCARRRLKANWRSYLSGNTYPGPPPGIFVHPGGSGQGRDFFYGYPTGDT